MRPLPERYSFTTARWRQPGMRAIPRSSPRTAIWDQQPVPPAKPGYGACPSWPRPSALPRQLLSPGRLGTPPSPSPWHRPFLLCSDLERLWSQDQQTTRMACGTGRGQCADVGGPAHVSHTRRLALPAEGRSQVIHTWASAACQENCVFWSRMAAASMSPLGHTWEPVRSAVVGRCFQRVTYARSSVEGYRCHSRSMHQTTCCLAG